MRSEAGCGVASEIAAKTGSCGTRPFLIVRRAPAVPAFLFQKERRMTRTELRRKLRNIPTGLFGRPAGL